jgi:hypothetical protein
MTAADKESHWPAGQGDPRAGLANWITDPETGAGVLLARVMVNRLWQHHFGQGLVRTPNDFGTQGEPPTHPELLDYLAGELIRGGWKLKPIHKLIMSSTVYQQAGDSRAEALAVDPHNRLWWRKPPRRLEAEIVRDSLLAVSGTLTRNLYGPGTLDANSPRRSVYLTVKRSQLLPLMQMFDAPEPIQSVGDRSQTTLPTQALAFMNSPLVRQRAEKLAQRLRTQAADPGHSVVDAYRIVLGRRPSELERQRLLDFMERQAASYGKAPKALEQALADGCQVLLCLNEFVYVD